MTVGMRQMNQMFRDFKVAEDVGKMMELRRFETAFELYGTVYWDKGERCYLTSQKAELISKEIVRLEMQDKYPLPLQIWQGKALIPSGWEEAIVKMGKLNFCQALRQDYSTGLWHHIQAVAGGRENDSGINILEPLQEQLDGSFQADYLQLFYGLLRILYLRKNLTRQSLTKYQNWL